MAPPDHLPDELRGLAALAERKELDLRPVLLRVLTDLYVGRPHHTPDEIRQYQAVAEGLIRQSDESVRAVVADKLADYALAPDSVLEALIAFGGPGATPILRRSITISRSLLADVAHEGEISLACAVAERSDLDTPLVRSLAERPEIEVLRALANNATAPLDRTTFERLAQRGRLDVPLARALCARASEPGAVAPLFLVASQIQRKAIILDARRADLGREFRTAPSEALLGYGREMEEAAASMDRARIEAIIADATGASPEITERIVSDPYGDPLALVLAMFAMTPQAASRVIVAVGGPVVTQERLQALATLVGDVAPETAARLVCAMTGTSAPETAAPRSTRHYLPASDAQAQPLPGRAPAPEPRPQAQAPEAPRKVIFLRRA